MYLTKTKQGHYIPSSDLDHEESKKLSAGTEVKATSARNVKFHRKAFALLKLGYDNQDKFTSIEVYRKILTIKAGYYDEVPGKDGHNYYIPKSLSFDSMSAEKFEAWFVATLDIIARDMDTASEIIRQELEGFY